MATRFPQSGSAVAYQIKSTYSSKIKVLYWAASADSVHRLRPGDTTTTIITRDTSGAGFSADGRITGDNDTTYFSDSETSGLNEQSDICFGAFAYGDLFNGIAPNVTLIGSSAPPDTFTNGFRLRTNTYTLIANLQSGAGGDTALGTLDVAEYMDVALRRNATDPINTFRQWFNGSEQTSYRRNAAATAATSISTLYFGGSAAGTGNTNVEWEGCFFASGDLTDAELNAITADPTALIEVAASGPELSSATGTATGQTTATIGATTDTGSGTLYGFTSASITPPSAADLKAGTGAVWSGSIAVSTTGAKTLSATGLTAGNSYYGHLIQNDGTDDSNIVTSAQFTTTSTTKYVKVLCHSSAQSATGLTAEVFEAPTGGALTGAKLGFDTAIAAEATLESGEAVILIPAADVGASGLAAATSVRVVFTGTTSAGSALGNAQPFGSVGVHTGTIVEV